MEPDDLCAAIRGAVELVVIADRIVAIVETMRREGGLSYEAGAELDELAKRYRAANDRSAD